MIHVKRYRMEVTENFYKTRNSVKHFHAIPQCASSWFHSDSGGRVSIIFSYVYVLKGSTEYMSGKAAWLFDDTEHYEDGLLIAKLVKI